MNRIALIAALVVGGSFVVGCSANSTSMPSSATKTATATGAMTVTGSVSSKLGTDNARAVAIGSNGKQIWTYLDAHGDFTLKLPVGTSYRVVIANQLASASAQKVIGKVAVPTGTTTTQWINAKKETSVDLGVLRKPGETTAAATTAATTGVSTKSLHISCGCSDDSGSYGGGDDSGSDWGGGSDSGDSWGGSNTGSNTGSGSGDSWGSSSGGSSSGGWGNGFSDDGYGGGYGFGDGGWSDSASGWDTGASDPVSNHNDDNPCFGGGDDEDDSSWASSSGAGGWGAGGSGASDPGVCDVCSGSADAVILAPSSSACGEYADTEITEKASFGSCPNAATTTTSSSSSSSSSGAIQALAPTTTSTPVGGACVVKAQCGTSGSCVAGKCASN